MKRFLLALALALLAPYALAASSVQERSPFAQGLWWDPSKPGSGFDMFNASGQVMVIWYTYDGAGQPVWYTSQGAQADIGTDWPLLKFHWNGTGAQPAQVGTLRLTVSAPEAATIKWTLDTSTGTIPIAPFIQSGMVNDVDDSGTWFDPTQPGWGVSILDQGEVLGAAVYGYDPSGAPTWAAGFGRTPQIALQRSTGSCPGCAYHASTAAAAGVLGFDWQGDFSITLHGHIDIPLANGIGVDGKRLSQLSRPASTRPADRQLARFDAASLRDFLARGMMNVPYFSGVEGAPGFFSPAPPGAAGGLPFSTTNLQEAGVDEAGLVKSDGRRVFTYDYSSSQRQASVRVAQVEPDGSKASSLGSVAIADGKAANVAQAGLLIYNDKLVSVHGSQGFSGYVTMASGSNWTNGHTQVEVLDIPASGLPTSRWKIDFDGYLVATRRIGGTLYVVSRFTPSLPGFVFGVSDPAIRSQNQARVDAADVTQLLPSLRLDANHVIPLAAAEKTYLPPEGTRLKMADLTTVTAIDLDQLAVRDTLTIAGSVETVYASSTALVFATSRWDTHAPVTGTYLPEPPFARTDVHVISLGDKAMSIVGTGSVEGSISATADQASFRISEYGGRVRIVTSNMNFQWGAINANRLTVVAPSTAVPGQLKTIAWLPNAQRPESLGKPRETLHATRFLGDRLYAVTFKKIDPLYVLDLSVPSDPRIAGSVEMPGFSDYLHPLPNGLLLGFGKDAIPAATLGDADFAWYQGLLVSLYDVSDAGKPVEKQRMVIGRRGSNSALLEHHHAFSELQVAPGRLAFSIPAEVNDGTPTYNYGDPNSTFYSWQYSGLLRFEVQGTNAADTKIVALPPLVTHSNSGSAYPPSPDPGYSGGRSVMFMNGTVYVGYGKFWHRDAAGSVTGPF